MERAGELERPPLSRRARAALRAAAALLLGGATACRNPPGGAAPPPVPAAPLDACALTSDSAPVPDTVSVGLAGAVDPTHAPAPATDAERLVFRQLYETLIRLDCTGAPRAGLAESWSASDSGRGWRLTLRAGARFQDGRVVTAPEVVASWLGRDATLPEGAALQAADDRTLILRLEAPSPAPPAWLADPALAVTRPVPGRAWPAGTGSYTVDSAAGGIVLTPLGGRRPTLVLPRLETGDARDWLDGGIDLVLTGDPTALSYAASRQGFAARPLPWDRTYLLLVPGAPPPVTSEWRESLARDAVRVEARPSAAPAWWTAFPACVGASSPGNPAVAAGDPRAFIGYPRDDATARDLAGRLSVLEGPGNGSRVAVAGLEPADMTRALAAGAFGAGRWQFVVPFPQVVLEPCGAAHQLMARAPWLTLASQIVPLIDTRRRVVWRRGAAAFTVDRDGVLRVR